ncbi:MAG: DegV family protein [Clostridia bacterium]|nr:DegV family protein [Clostridia bacterium]
MSVKIVIDSTADLPAGEAAKFVTVPLTIHFGEQEYIDGVTITHREFYEKLIESDVLPTTSQATPASFDRVLRPIVEAGDTAVVITVSSKLSGTCQSACIAAAEYPGKVFVVDSNSVALGAGILAQLGLRLAEQGMSAADIALRLMEERENLRLIALLDTLEYLKRGGRISKTVAFAGGLLNIKPVICIREGAIEMLGKARGSKQGNNLLVKEIEQAGGVDFAKPLMLGYTGISDALLQKYIQDSAHLWEGNIDHLPQTVIGSVVGTHAGPGAVAVAFFAK